ncbi:MAG TPA: hypothetical protein VFS75_03885 [Candidatus Paceibacterota bacterium]|nr:hypothetical protein [Candidatus Paceibacterota bacterium]
MKGLRSFLAVMALFVVSAQYAYAGFGVTPPYVSNVSLTRNSVYEQTIYLVRSDPSTDLKATVSVDVPGINDWFTINEGNEFLLPAGEQKVPMTVHIAVPDNADFKKYDGNIRIKTGPPDDKVAGGAVSISLGAQIDVNLVVIDKEIKDFKVRKIGISDLNEGHKVGWLYFPGKIRFEMLIENIGNVPVAPSDVVFRIYDRSGNVLLEETHKKGRITNVDPFKTESVFAELPTKLPAGSYLARFEIKNGDETKLSGEVNVSILPYGTLQAAGFGFLGLSLAHQLSIVVPILFLLVAAMLIYVRTRRRR